MRKAYLAAPFRAKAGDMPDRAYGIVADPSYRTALESIEHVIASWGFEVCVPHRDEGDWGHTYIEPALVTKRCFDRIRGSDLVVALPGSSRGVHVELGYAAALGKRLVVFLPEGERESTLLPGVLAITPSVIRRFRSVDEVPSVLRAILTELDGPETATSHARHEDSIIGLVDIGSNTTKLVVAVVRDQGPMIVHRDARSDSRLAENLLPDRILSAPAIQRTAAIVRDFVSEAKSRGADRVRAVSTGAARDALNSGDLIEACRSLAGVHVEILSARDEAELLHRGVLADFEDDRQYFAVLNIGGVSTELTLGTKNTIEEVVSLRLGALSLTERFLRSDPPTEAELEALGSHLDIALSPHKKARQQSPVLVHTGGELDYLTTTGCPLWPSSLSPSHPVCTDSHTFAAFCARMKSLTLESLRAFMPKNPRWMDGAIASNEITRSTVKHLNVKQIIPSNKNLADGLLRNIILQVNTVKG